MYPELQALIHEAEFQYLNASNLNNLSHHVSTLQERFSAYQIIRDQEITIFQKIADKLLVRFAQQNPQQIEIAIRHWLLIMRYCGMAMLLNNPEFLERRLLEWLTDVVKAHELETIETSLYSILIKELQEYLSDGQMSYLRPFLEQGKKAVMSTEGMLI